MRILLFCYDFPPNQGIGGRRWAKFAKGLAQEGHQVHVILASERTGNTPSPWSDDVSLPDIKLHYLQRKFPEVIDVGPTTVWQKLTYRIELFKLKMTVKGTIYDQACQLEKSILRLANKLVEEESIEAVIATGAPFSMLYYGALTKRTHPHLKFLADYRDPWLTARNLGMPSLSVSRKKEEMRKQAIVFAQADVVTSPYLSLNATMQKEAHSKPRFEVLPHFFDPDDVPDPTQNSGRTDKIHLVYGGALYLELDPYLEWFARCLHHLRDKAPALYDRLEVDFYTADSQFKRFFSGLENKVRFHAPIGKNFFKVAQNATAALVFLTESKKDHLTTKFFELLPLRKPLFYFGPDGFASSQIQAQSLGHLNTSTEAFTKNIQQLTENNVVELPWPEEHTLQFRTKQLSRYLH